MGLVYLDLEIVGDGMEVMENGDLRVHARASGLDCTLRALRASVWV